MGANLNPRQDLGKSDKEPLAGPYNATVECIPRGVVHIRSRASGFDFLAYSGRPTDAPHDMLLLSEWDIIRIQPFSTNRAAVIKPIFVLVM
jgi:hypothetical protein